MKEKPHTVRLYLPFSLINFLIRLKNLLYDFPLSLFLNGFRRKGNCFLAKSSHCNKKHMKLLKLSLKKCCHISQTSL